MQFQHFNIVFQTDQDKQQQPQGAGLQGRAAGDRQHTSNQLLSQATTSCTSQTRVVFSVNSNRGCSRARKYQKTHVLLVSRFLSHSFNLILDQQKGKEKGYD